MSDQTRCLPFLFEAYIPVFLPACSTQAEKEYKSRVWRVMWVTPALGRPKLSGCFPVYVERFSHWDFTATLTLPIKAKVTNQPKSMNLSRQPGGPGVEMLSDMRRTLACFSTLWEDRKEGKLAGELSSSLVPPTSVRPLSLLPTTQTLGDLLLPLPLFSR